MNLVVHNHTVLVTYLCVLRALFLILSICLDKLPSLQSHDVMWRGEYKATSRA
uniref:Uncharacterized protein n=1 Tax=Anguilla anguilla TaxID=7936 RepID=A0A0E9UIB5_ANGAN